MKRLLVLVILVVGTIGLAYYLWPDQFAPLVKLIDHAGQPAEVSSTGSERNSQSVEGVGAGDTAAQDTAPRLVSAERGQELKAGPLQTISPRDPGQVMVWVRVLHAPKEWGDPKVPLYLKATGPERFESVVRVDIVINSDGSEGPVGAGFAVPSDVNSFTLVLEGLLSLPVSVSDDIAPSISTSG